MYGGGVQSFGCVCGASKKERTKIAGSYYHFRLTTSGEKKKQEKRERKRVKKYHLVSVVSVRSMAPLIHVCEWIVL